MNDQGLHWADIAVIVMYLVGITALGVYAARKVTNLADFVMPRRFGKAMMVMFSFGTGTHADQAVSVSSKVYTSGISGIWYQWLWLFVTPFYWPLAMIMSRFRALTTADVFEARYDRSVSILYAGFSYCKLMFSIGLMLRGAAEVIHASTGGLVHAELAIIFMTILFVAYGMAGGLGAAIVTDMVQGVLTIVFSFMLLPMILYEVGGIDGIRQAIPAVSDKTDMMSLIAPSEITVFYITIIAFNGLVGIVAQPHTMGNCAAGRSELQGQIGFMGGNLLKRLCTIAWALTGLAAVVYLAGTGQGDMNPDQIFGQVARDFLPTLLPGLLGLFIAALLASMMSTCDAFMIAASGLFTENFYKQFVKHRSHRHYLWVARISSLLVVAGGVFFAFSLEGVVQGLEVLWKLSSMLGIAFWLGLFWRRGTVAGAWASAFSAFAAWWLTTQAFFVQAVDALALGDWFALVVTKDGQLMINLPWQMLFYLLIGFGTGVVVSLLTKPVPTEKLDRFYELTRTPVRPDEQVVEPCTLPVGVQPPPRRVLFPNSSFEVPIPRRMTVSGFLVGWLCVVIIIGGFFAILR